MKILFYLVLAAVVIVIGVKLSVGSPDESIPSATETIEETTTTTDTNSAVDIKAAEKIPAGDITVAFTGYGPGKQHNGNIIVKESTLERTGSIFSGNVIFDMTSITSDNDKVSEHLKTADFFDAIKYPTAKFVVTESSPSQIKGDLTIKGITQAIALPVSVAVDSTTTSEVRINMELFGIKQTFADKEFVVKVTIK